MAECDVQALHEQLVSVSARRLVSSCCLHALLHCVGWCP